ncbi:hypothetical protein E2562_005760 [Oryza meyeriana var. granulata]|uniref:Protein kinase domain-containing protein n=1 Tax=Oryza meyeriana var. granulata TaxID=110450 RepID=A0A6G1F4D8_9ORYZ|nr:hypothetical protein E2562_005760 [Oryza meyeriana var. granulata]
MGCSLMQLTTTWPWRFFFYLSVHLLFLSPINSLNQSYCDRGDGSALQGFLQGLGGSGISGWTVANGTSETANCCAWLGVKCNDGGRVIGLDLQGMKLRGELAASLAQLDQLQWLNLSNNNLHGVVPAPLVQLQRLQRLDLSDNEFSGEFPTNVSLPVIEVFNISFNSFNKQHPTLHGSSHLAMFDAGYNMFMGHIDTSICDPNGAIQVLRFTSNLLSGDFPAGFGNCTKLEELYVDLNSISGNLPGDLFRLSSLKNLSLQENQLSGRMTSRTGKGLRYNQVSSFPPSLILSHNKLIGPILPGFGSLKNLYVLDLSNNHISGSAYEGNPKLCGIRFGLAQCQSYHVPTMPAKKNGKNKGVILGIAIGIALGAAFVLSAAVVLVLKSSFRRQDYIVKAVADTAEPLELAPASLVLLFQNKDDGKAMTIGDILKSTNNFDPANIIGCGGFGLVYKAILPDGQTIAIKRLSGDFSQMEREFKAEVETLSKAQHPNLVLLQELLTGKRPVDMCKPKGARELVSWVLHMKEENREAEVLDHAIPFAQAFRRTDGMRVRPLMSPSHDRTGLRTRPAHVPCPPRRQRQNSPSAGLAVCRPRLSDVTAAPRTRCVPVRGSFRRRSVTLGSQYGIAGASR